MLVNLNPQPGFYLLTETDLGVMLSKVNINLLVMSSVAAPLSFVGEPAKNEQTLTQLAC